MSPIMPSSPVDTVDLDHLPTTPVGPSTPTDQPVEMLEPMAPVRVTRYAKLANSASLDPWYHSGSGYSLTSPDPFGSSKKTKRVIAWGDAGGVDTQGDVIGGGIAGVGVVESV